MTHPLITAALAMPHTHQTVTIYDDGTTREHSTRCAASAEMFAIGERRKIGRDLIDRDTGKIRHVLGVVVEPIQRRTISHRQ